MMARGTRCSVERTTNWPFEKISCLVTLRTDMFCGPGLRNPYVPLALTMEMGRIYDYWKVSG
jgi:hypothetical protein